MGRGNETLFAASGSHDQDGRHAHIDVLVTLFNRNRLDDIPIHKTTCFIKPNRFVSFFGQILLYTSHEQVRDLLKYYVMKNFIYERNFFFICKGKGVYQLCGN